MNRPHLIFGLLSMFGVMGSPAWGAWTETISTSGGTALDLDASWAFAMQNGGTPGSVFTGASSGVLEISDTLPYFDGMAFTGTFGGFGLVTTESFQNVIVSATINPNAASDMNNSVGLVARSNGIGGGYGLIYDFVNSELHLLEFAAGVPAYIASQDLALPAADDYFMKLSVVGSNLVGELYASDGGTLLSSVATSDATYTSGLSGVLVFVDDFTTNTPIKGVWDNISSVPEPTSLSLGVSSLAAFGLWRRRRMRWMHVRSYQPFMPLDSR